MQRFHRALQSFHTWLCKDCVVSIQTMYWHDTFPARIMPYPWQALSLARAIPERMLYLNIQVYDSITIEREFFPKASLVKTSTNTTKFSTRTSNILAILRKHLIPEKNIYINFGIGA